MRYTTQFALLAAAFAATVLAGPLADRSVDHQLEAREVATDDISARELHHRSLEDRSYPGFNTRSVDDMDLEAREYVEYLEARHEPGVQCGVKHECDNRFHRLPPTAEESKALLGSGFEKAFSNTKHPLNGLAHAMIQHLGDEPTEQDLERLANGESFETVKENPTHPRR